LDLNAESSICVEIIDDLPDRLRKIKVEYQPNVLRHL